MSSQKFAKVKSTFKNITTAIQNTQVIPKEAIRKLTARNLNDLIRNYLNAKANGTEEQYMVNIISSIQEEARTYTNEENANTVQQMVFINMLGYDTTWGDFTVLEVMTLEDYSAKRIAYTAAAQMWNSNSDVVLMATNRIQRDLTSVNTLLTSCVLTSLPPYLTSSLASGIAHDVISLMTSAKPYIRQKAIMTFYHICLRHPDALKPGFVTLRGKLDDDDPSVVFAALTVISELCQHNPSNFVPLIPTLHKMLLNSTSNWVTLRLITILKMLCKAEPRLPKKLITPFTNILDTTSSITLLFECVRSIIEIPITNTVLLTYASQRMQAFLEHQDVNLRFLCLTLFIKLMQIQPKLVSQHKELITQCLDSEDEETRLMALDLLAALANSKTIDGIVAKMFMHFKESKNQHFKNQIVTRIIEICSKADYALISDFDWYINVLMDFIDEGGLSTYDLIADQFLDLALRVPVTRPLLVQELSKLFADTRYKNESKLLLAASHIVGDYSENSDYFESVLHPQVVQMSERVQSSCISTAFKLFLKSKSNEDRLRLEEIFNAKLQIFATSQYAEVQDVASLTSNIIKILKEEESENIEASRQTFNELNKRLTPVDEEEEPEPIPVPEELNQPCELFAQLQKETLEMGTINESVDSNLLDGIVKSSKTGRKRVKKVAHQKQTNEKVVILKAHNKILPGQNQFDQSKSSGKPADPLSNALASVDLTETVAETEARVNQPQQIPYDQSLQQKKKALEASQKSHSGKVIKRKKSSTPASTAETPENNVEKKPTLRRRRIQGKSGENQQNPQGQNPQSSPITGPVEGARAQMIGSNSMFNVTVLEFTPELSSNGQNKLTIELNVHNDTAVAIQSINIELNNTDNSLQLLTEPCQVPEVPGRGDTQYTFDLGVSEIIKPHIAKLTFIPSSTGADTLEASIRIFPSFFLINTNESSLAESEQNATNESVVDFSSSQIKPKELLQTIVNITRGTIISTDDIHVRKILSKTTEGHPVVAILKADKESTILTIKCSEEALLQALTKEIKMKTQVQ